MTYVPPKPDGSARHLEANTRRLEAADVAKQRPQIQTLNNNEINEFTVKPTNFHKGLPHDAFGIVDISSFQTFVEQLARPDDAGTFAQFDVPLGPTNADRANVGQGRGATQVDNFFGVISADGIVKAPMVRLFESPLGGHGYDLEGPDAGDLAMAPVPKLGFSELCAELAELYAMALLRDVPFAKLGDRAYRPALYSLARSLNGAEELVETGRAPYTVGDVVDALGKLSWLDPRGNTYASDGNPLDEGNPAHEHESRRRKARFTTAGGFDISVLFRGSVPGAKDGPYLSQFLLIGSARGAATAAVPAEGTAASTPPVDAGEPRLIAPLALPLGAGARAAEGPVEPAIAHQLDAPLGTSTPGAGPSPAASVTGARSPADARVSRADGYITYGAQRIDQRVFGELPGRDYMTLWPLWLDVQNGADVRSANKFYPDGAPRFVHTPRALASYVHFDQLYQAYLNACLLMLDAKLPFDYGLPSGPAHVTRGSFATFGGPHVLSLVTEVASRALKAVRRQKFQYHLRGRPEQLAGMLTLAASNTGGRLDDARRGFESMLKELGETGLLAWIDEHNARQNAVPDRLPRLGTVKEIEAGSAHGKPVAAWKHQFSPAAGANYLMPMAFPEGSPMHPSYGAGHATVAGACVTVLKAFFEMSTLANDFDPSKRPPTLTPAINGDGVITASPDEYFTRRSFKEAFATSLYLPPSSEDPQEHLALKAAPDADITLEGELNKLAANIAIGRNMAGVHFYNDYFDSVRLGERIAVGILLEQFTNFPDPFTMRLTTFDDERLVLSGDGKGTAAGLKLLLADGTHGGTPVNATWWGKHKGRP